MGLSVSGFCDGGAQGGDNQPLVRSKVSDLPGEGRPGLFLFNVHFLFLKTSGEGLTPAGGGERDREEESF